MLYPNESRVGGTAAILGSLLLVIGTYFHPMHADPNDAVAAFTEYAADDLWVTSHMLQLAGATLILGALLLLARQLESAGVTPWSRTAAAGAIASLAMATALQAVDGIALKHMVDAWAIAPAAQKDSAFYAALAVRQVEIGLAGTTSLLFGLTMNLYGAALLADHTYPKWLGGIGIAAGVATMVAGIVIAHGGFSGLAMAISVPASSLLLVWMLALGVLMWRRADLGPINARMK